MEMESIDFPQVFYLGILLTEQHFVLYSTEASSFRQGSEIPVGSVFSFHTWRAVFVLEC